MDRRLGVGRAPLRTRVRARLTAAAAAAAVLLLYPGSALAQQVLVNSATSTYQTFAGLDSISSNSDHCSSIGRASRTSWNALTFLDTVICGR